jgi:hypothetical protein
LRDLAEVSAQLIGLACQEDHFTTENASLCSDHSAPDCALG